MLHHSNWTMILSISFSPMRTLFFSYWTKYFPNTLWYIIFPTTNKNVLKCLRWGSDVLKFSLNWGSAMFLRCSYFFQNLSLDVLINKVLKQSNACMLKEACFVEKKFLHWFYVLTAPISSSWSYFGMILCCKSSLWAKEGPKLPISAKNQYFLKVSR